MRAHLLPKYPIIGLYYHLGIRYSIYKSMTGYRYSGYSDIYNIIAALTFPRLADIR